MGTQWPARLTDDFDSCMVKRTLLDFCEEKKRSFTLQKTPSKNKTESKFSLGGRGGGGRILRKMLYEDNCHNSAIIVIEQPPIFECSIVA